MAEEKIFCCKRYQESVEEELFIHSDVFDETEWYIPGGYHIYFCPYCGSYIAGKGFGEPEKPFQK